MPHKRTADERKALADMVRSNLCGKEVKELSDDACDLIVGLRYIKLMLDGKDGEIDIYEQALGLNAARDLLISLVHGHDHPIGDYVIGLREYTAGRPSKPDMQAQKEVYASHFAQWLADKKILKIGKAYAEIAKYTGMSVHEIKNAGKPERSTTDLFERSKDNALNLYNNAWDNRINDDQNDFISKTCDWLDILKTQDKETQDKKLGQ